MLAHTYTSFWSHQSLECGRCGGVQMKNALSERSAMSVRYDVRAWFEAELRKNSGNLKGVVQWGNDLARAANAYIRTGDPDQFVDMHLALMKPVPKELREEARKSLLFSCAQMCWHVCCKMHYPRQIQNQKERIKDYPIQVCSCAVVSDSAARKDKTMIRILVPNPLISWR